MDARERIISLRKSAHGMRKVLTAGYKLKRLARMLWDTRDVTSEKTAAAGMYARRDLNDMRAARALERGTTASPFNGEGMHEVSKKTCIVIPNRGAKQV